MKDRLSDRAKSIKSSMTLAITAKAKELEKKGFDVIAFGVGEPDFDTPDEIKEAAIKAIKDGHTKYTPATGILELRELICKRFKERNKLDYTPEQIITNSGAKHSLSTAFQTILNPGEEVILVAPYWVSYPEIIKIAGGVPKIVNTKEENDFKLAPDELKKAITAKTKAILLNTPSNPVGSVYNREELEKIAEIALENNLFVVSDEIYERLIYDGIKHVSIAEISAEVKDKTIIINGMSKDFAMTGWRLGYAAGNEEVISAMAKIQGHAVSHPSSISQYAGIGALKSDDTEFIKMHAEYDKRRKYMVKRLKRIDDLTYIYPSGAFYVFININKLLNKKYGGKLITNSLELSDALLDIERVAVVPGISFGLDGYIRISYATSMESIEKGLDRIEDFIKKGV